VPLKSFVYSLVRYVPDVVRGEAINLGVVVVSEVEHRAASRFSPQFKQRLGLLDPNVDVGFVQRVLTSISALFQSEYQVPLGATDVEAVTTESGLAHLVSVMVNQIQLSPPTRYRGTSLESVVEHLYGALVAPMAKRKEWTEQRMTVGRIRELIKEAITQWHSNAVRVEDAKTERAGVATHYADFWLNMGVPTAAFLAIPDDPDEQHIAWYRRDSLPTVVHEFRLVNPTFQAVAVFPPVNGGDRQFIAETKSLLDGVDGVTVTSVDRLPELRDQLIPHMV
jgi:hypothetical protein